jgi:serine phosphatase RsbU (regulator of sigma subunit)
VIFPGDDLVAIYQRTPCALLSIRADGTVLEANDTLLTWIARDRDEVVGRCTVFDLFTVGGRIYWETHLSPMLQVEGQLTEVALDLGTRGGRMPVLLSARAQRDDAGRTEVVRIAMASAAERRGFEQELIRARVVAERSEARLATLQGVTAALSEAVGPDAVARVVLEAAVNQLGAAAGTVWVLDPEVGHVELASMSQRSSLPLPVSPDAMASFNLRGQSELQGLLALVEADDAAEEAWDLTTLNAVAQQAGIALERARLFDQHARVANTLQQSLLAADPPLDPRFDVATAYRPGVEGLDVGGDWYDVFLSDDDLLSVVVGDVVGRGLKAASAMGQLRSAVRAVSGPEVGPARVIARLDRFVQQVEAANMATVAHAELDLGSGVLSYACAGHPPPVLLPASGEPRLLWGGRSTPLGIVPDPLVRSQDEIKLLPGDRLMLYTDGLIERRDRDIEAGLDALAQACSALDDLPPADTVRAVMDVMLRDEQHPDDVCVLLLSFDPASVG